MNLNVTVYDKDDNIVSTEFVNFTYTEHSYFREDLIKLIGRDDLLIRMNKVIDWEAVIKEVEMPFLELIRFSDCEGTIESDISTKLHSDFVEWYNKITDTKFKAKYLKWLKVFNIGKEPGNKVVFH